MAADARDQALAVGRRVHERIPGALRNRDPSAGADSEPPGHVRECLLRAARSAAFRDLLNRPVRLEDSFDLYGFYTGRMDAWYEADDDVAVVIDWKTGDVDPTVHHVQRVIYALALLCHYDTVRVRTVNIGPHPWPDEEETFTYNEVGAMRAALAAHVATALALARAPVEGPGAQSEPWRREA